MVSELIIYHYRPTSISAAISFPSTQPTSPFTHEIGLQETHFITTFSVDPCQVLRLERLLFFKRINDLEKKKPTMAINKWFAGRWEGRYIETKDMGIIKSIQVTDDMHTCSLVLSGAFLLHLPTKVAPLCD